MEGQPQVALVVEHAVRVAVAAALGPAYIDGFGRALALGADYVVEMDADFQHDPRTLLDFRRWIEEYDIVVGSRYIPGGSVEPGWSIPPKNGPITYPTPPTIACPTSVTDLKAMKSE